MPKKAVAPPTKLTPYRTRVLSHLFHRIVRDLDALPGHAAVEIAELLVARLRTHYNMGATKPCSKPSPSPPSPSPSSTS